MTRRRRPIAREAVGLYEAKAHLSALVERAAEGEEIIITKSGKPKARLVPLDDTRPLRKAGLGRGRWKVGEDFDEPLPDEFLSFGGAARAASAWEIAVKASPGRIETDRRLEEAVAQSG